MHFKYSQNFSRKEKSKTMLILVASDPVPTKKARIRTDPDVHP
jgi:hypothetical protein